MNWADAHRIAMIEAAHAHSELEIDTARPVDVFDAIRRQGVVLGFEYFPRLSGVYVADAAAPGIAVSSQHGLARQRYTAAHELAHHRFGHGTTVDPEIDPLATWGSTGAGQMSDNEKIAEAFAAWFLMPRKLVAATLATLGLNAPETPADVYQLSLRLGTSYRATARHLSNIKLVTQVRSRQWLSVEPRTIKAELLPDVQLDLRRDVWLLTSADDGHRYWVRPSDKLVLNLAETPSSGYVWHVGDADKLLTVYSDTTGLPSSRTSDSPVTTPADRETWPVGQEFARTVVLTVELADERLEALDAAGSDRLQTTLAATLRQPWDETTTAASFVISLDIRPPRRGIDPEALLAA